MRPPSPEAGCNGKAAFDDKRLADQVAGRSRRGRDASISTYRCPWCRRWHIGSHPARKHKQGRSPKLEY